ncbi:hypothetical protein [Schnuerera sp.]|uniref:hypothetical protein n=1 Tax=Schnuerera sp. TaxID=2794844 RepID=UPI002BABF663|nr:hypothetical protein [Schnuerera sp.]HSH37064.1 hypothetical protein [Schnuerera sp.]
MEELNVEDLGKILEVMDTDCVIVDKVFASCQQRECFPQIEVDLKGKTFEDIKFKPGFIVPNTLVVTDIDSTPNFKRVRFTLRIPFKIITTEGKEIEGFLPDILKDIILFIPDSRDEFEFRIVVETSSQVLGQPIQTEDTLTFAVGVFIIVKVVGTVQLLVPTLGYCPPPEFCEEFSPEDVCDNFDYLPLPDFFPPQFGQLYPDD